MVDSEDLGLVEDGADCVVDLLGRGQVVADRLLQDHAALLVHQVVVRETRAVDFAR